MADVRSEYVHERRLRCFIDRHELERVIADHAKAQAGYAINAPGLTVKVRFEDAMEGSPQYKVGTKATVEIIEDLSEDRPIP